MNKDKLIKSIDFWRKSVENDMLFDREILNTINIKSSEIVDIIGPRRSGKSSILKLIIQQLKLKDNYLFINFEDPYFIENDKAEIIDEIIEVYKEYFNKDLKYLFFDEVQVIDGWERAIRKLQDGTKYKIFLTGSSSQLLSKELSSAITGRHLSYKVFPLNFKEYIFFKKIVIKNKKDIILSENKLKKNFELYLKIGGFPGVVLQNDIELLKNYFYDFIQRDVAMRYNVRDLDALEKLAVFLISNSGKIYSIESIKNNFNLSYDTARDYINYLRDAFVVFELRQFSFSLKKQSKAQKKIYTIDTGLANAISFRFSQDDGRILENAIFLYLKNMYNEIYYYKTKNDLEVDFLVKQQAEVKDLIQVCLDINDRKTRDRELKAMSVAMDELKIKRATLITKDCSEKIDINGKTVMIVPAWRWMLEKSCNYTN